MAQCAVVVIDSATALWAVAGLACLVVFQMVMHRPRH